MKEMRESWKTYLNERLFKDLGIDESESFRDLAAEAMHFWHLMEKRSDRLFLWSDLTSVQGSTVLTRNFVRLRNMAIALHKAGSELEGNEQLGQDIVEALDWMFANQYNAKAETHGNWWDWEIGAPMALTETLLLMSSYMSSDKMEAYLSPIDIYTPNPNTFLNSTTHYPTMVSAGANRVWICKVITLRSLLLEDEFKLIEVRDALSPLFEYVKGGEGGFLVDGSFLQHGYPYTGGYGKALLSSLVPLLHVLEGTPFEVIDPNKIRIFDWVYQAFEPLLYRGSILDMVSGREVSRYNLQNHDSGHIAIGAMLELASFAPTPHADKIKSMVKHWIMEDKYKSFMTHVSSYLRGLAEELLQDERVIPGAPAPKYKVFSGMARAVVQQPEFALGISMSSKRIATFESINGENLKGWYHGHGYTSLYNSDLGQYSDGYWPTVDPIRLAGTTVTNQPREKAFGNLYRSGECWAGGTEQNLYGSAGMVLEDYKTNPNEMPMRANKSWFIFKDEIVALGSDISFEGPFRVETTVENRKLNDEGTNRFIVNGQVTPDKPGWTATLPETSWIHLQGNVSDTDIGYYFPNKATLQSTRETRTGKWSDIGNGPDTEISRNYITVWFDHGVSPHCETYAYVLLPGKNAEETKHYADHPNTHILLQSSEAHAVYHAGLDILGMNVWTDGKISAGGVTCLGKASVMVRATDDSVEVALSDPTQENNGIIEIELDMAVSSVEKSDPRIEVVQLSPKVKLHVHTGGTYGSTLSVTLSKSK